MININSIFNIEKGSSLFFWLFSPFLTTCVLISNLNLSDASDREKLRIILFLFFSYLVVFLVIFFLIKIFKKSGEKENPSKKDKKEPENKKSDVDEEEIKKWRELFSESLREGIEKDREIDDLKKKISELEAQINYLKSKN